MARRRREAEFDLPEERVFFGAPPPEGRWQCPRGEVPTVRLALTREGCAPKSSTWKLKSPQSVYVFLTEQYGCEAQEWALALGLDAAAHPIAIQEITLGGMNTTSVDPKVLFSGLLLMGASSFVFAHNHPSGNPEFSDADVQLTRALKDASRTLTIRMVDHMLITRGGYTSMVEQGLF